MRVDISSMRMCILYDKGLYYCSIMRTHICIHSSYTYLTYKRGVEQQARGWQGLPQCFRVPQITNYSYIHYLQPDKYTSGKEHYECVLTLSSVEQTIFVKQRCKSRIVKYHVIIHVLTTYILVQNTYCSYNLNTYLDITIQWNTRMLFTKYMTIVRWSFISSGRQTTV